MKFQILLPALALTLTPLAGFTSDRPWEAQIACNGHEAVIDRAIVETGAGAEVLAYQLVIRNPAAISYLASALSLTDFINEEGEAVIPVTRYPAKVTFSGDETFVSNRGSIRLEASVEFGASGVGLNVRAVEIQYYGRQRVELLSWNFHPCELR